MPKTNTITNSDMMFFYFEMLKNTAPRSVLDVGMFLKRIGAVCRHAMSSQVSEDIVLCGVDLFPQYEMPVYEMIYDEIVSKDSFLETEECFSHVDRGQFDIAVMLEVSEYFSDAEETILWDRLSKSVSNIMTDAQMAERMVANRRIRGYYPVSAGSSTYAWIPLAELM